MLRVNRRRLSEEEQQKVNTRLFLAVRDNSLSAVRSAVNDGARVNARDENDVPVLLWAISGGNEAVGVVNYLIEKGANVNHADPEGNTPLLDALRYFRYVRQQELVALLLSKGARATVANNDGITPLLRSVRYSTDIAAMLIEKGGDVNAVSKEGLTPLMNASSTGAVATMRLLIDNGADVNAADSIGDTPLMHAARTGSKTRVELLLEHGADINAADQMGNTALRYVINQSYNPDLVEFMLFKGADPVAPNRDGETLWALAQRKGYWRVGWQLEEAGAPQE